jgi:carboxyl-terminal processing protease
MNTTLLAGTVFLIGAMIAPVSELYERHFVRTSGINAAFAQDEDHRPGTYQLLKLFGDVFELVRGEYVDPVSDKELIENAIKGMLVGLDPHSDYMSAEAFREMQEADKGEFVGIGIEITQENGLARVISPIDDAPAAKAGIKAGDYIIALNGKPVEARSLDDMIRKMRGPPNTRISLTIRRVGVDRPIVVSIQRKVIRTQVVKQRLERGNIGYVRITEFIEPVDAALKHAARSLERRAGGRLTALVLDLRDNPGGLIDTAVAVAREFVPRGEIASTRDHYPEDSEWWAAKGIDILKGAPMVVLINSGSASASELLAGALQDHRRAVLLGTRTFGKGSVQTTIALPGGGAMLLTTGRYYTPSGRSIQGRGIAPDILVAGTRDEAPHFDPEHEADFNHVLTASGGVSDSDEPSRADLPPIVGTIPNRPPKGFPDFNPARSETDFQLQQALVVARAIATAQNRTSAPSAGSHASHPSRSNGASLPRAR